MRPGAQAALQDFPQVRQRFRLFNIICLPLMRESFDRSHRLHIANHHRTILRVERDQFGDRNQRRDVRSLPAVRGIRTESDQSVPDVVTGAKRRGRIRKVIRKDVTSMRDVMVAANSKQFTCQMIVERAAAVGDGNGDTMLTGILPFGRDRNIDADHFTDPLVEDGRGTESHSTIVLTPANKAATPALSSRCREVT